MILTYHQWGPLAREISKLTFLHGLGGTGQLWRPVAASLEDDYAVLALDQRGHGGSRPVGASGPAGARNPASFAPLDYGHDIRETLVSLDFLPTWLIGHSMGVRSACAAAYLMPETIRGLILVDLGFSGPAGGGMGEDLAQFIRLLPESFASRALAREFMNQHCPDPAIGQYLLAVSITSTTQDSLGEIRFPFDHQALVETIRQAAMSSVRGWVHSFGERNLPILVLRGGSSRVWSQEQYLTEKAEFSKYPSIRFEEVPGAGHGLPFEQRAAFVAKIREFCV